MKCDPAGMHRGVDLISDALLFSRLWYGEPRARRAQHERLGGLKSGVKPHFKALRAKICANRGSKIPRHPEQTAKVKARISCSVAMLLLFAHTALGRIGEKQAQIEKRYGQPTSGSHWTKTYRYEDFFVIVTFDDGVSGIETYEKCNGAPMSAVEIGKLLDANGDGTKWQEPIRNGLEVRYKQKTCFAEYNAITNTLTVADYAALRRINARNRALDAHK